MADEIEHVPNPPETVPHPSRRGFAAMDPEKRREIARRGGKASGGRPENLRGVDRRAAGRKGGQKVLAQYGPEHMAQIGRHGGEKVVQQYGAEHMAEIGRQGGQARGGRARERREGPFAPNPPSPEQAPETTPREEE
ncbi:MAG: KGG domain-containing protein [Thermoplasmatota archaeon]